MSPNNADLYKLALIHKSSSVYTSDGVQMNNERLEFLGDAIIESAVSDYLYIEYPDKSEGFLTQLRSKIVNRGTLNSVGLKMGLNRYVVIHTSNYSAQKHVYGDAFEALMGAMYLDKGYNYTNRFIINKVVRGYLDIEEIASMETDFKSRLIEWCQKSKFELKFDCRASGAFVDHNPQFACTVTINGDVYGQGTGTSKKEAEQDAARIALADIHE